MRAAASFDRLRAELGAFGRVVVAFSGGADSGFLAKVATDTLGRLAAVDAAESALRALGLGGRLRVRHHGETARLEVEPEALAAVVARRQEVVAAVRAAGFTFVALDLEGFRSGSLNRVLAGADEADAEAARP